MHIAVIGAGIAGAVAALTLVREGHTVEVLEAAGGPAIGASFANAGLVSPGGCFSWAEPGAVGMAVKSLLGLSDGMGIMQPWDPALLRWGLLFAREATHERWLANSRAALTLSAYSRDVQFTEPQIPLEAYGGRRAGILYLYGEGQKPGTDDSRLLREAGEAFETLDAAQILEREPLLREAAHRFSSGVYCAGDATGNAAQYAAMALKLAQTLGAEVRYHEPVSQLRTRGNAVIGVETIRGQYAADGVVVAAGLDSRQLLRRHGYKLPIYPVTGYSVTYEGRGHLLPCMGAVSIPDKIAWAAFGSETVRFTGFADVGIPRRSHARNRFLRLEQFAGAIYPGARGATPLHWVGQRPMTPDNLPFLGPSGHANLWLNCGHGAMGWTMASGSARVLADLIANRNARIDLTPFRWDRF